LALWPSGSVWPRSRRARTAAPTKSAANSTQFTGPIVAYGYATTYINLPGAVDSSTFHTRFWQTNDQTKNENTFSVPNSGATNRFFQDPYPGYSTAEDFSFSFEPSAAGTNGCITGCMTIYVEDYATGRFVQWTIPEGFVNTAAEFDFSQVNPPFGDGPQTLSPRIRGISSGRVATTVNVNFDIPDVSAGVFANPGSSCAGGTGLITGRQAYMQQSATLPSTNIAGWSLLGVEAAGDTTVAARSNGFDCSNTALDWWIAIGLEQNNVAPRFVSQPVQVECDPNLADPHGGFKKIDRPNATPRTQGRD
jgi:hypothetical protein